MSKVKSLWHDEYERTLSAVAAHQMKPEVAVRRLRRLGFEPDEAADHVEAAVEEQEE